MTTKLVRGFRAHVGESHAPVEQERLSRGKRKSLGCLARRRHQQNRRALELAESTVKIHIQNIFQELNISSRVRAALYAVEPVTATKNPSPGARRKKPRPCRAGLGPVGCRPILRGEGGQSATGQAGGALQMAWGTDQFLDMIGLTAFQGVLHVLR